MNTAIRRAMAVVMAIFSALSLVVTIILLVGTWQTSDRLQNQLLSGLDTTQAALDSASNGLVVTKQVLSDTQGILKGMSEMMLSITASVHEVPPVLKNLEDLTGTSIPETISATKLSLVTAQDSAGRIEDMLKLVSQIPFFPGGKYEPQVTLKDSLGKVADNIEGFRQPLEDMQKSLKSTRTNLEGVEGGSAQVSTDLKSVANDLTDAGQTLSESQKKLEDLSHQLKLLEQKIPVWMVSLTWVLTFLLVWVGLAQIGWLIYAISLL